MTNLNWPIKLQNRQLFQVEQVDNSFAGRKCLKATSAEYKSNAKGVFFCQKEGVDLVVATRWMSTLNCGLFFEFASRESNNVLLNKGLCVHFGAMTTSSWYKSIIYLGSVAMAFINLYLGI